MQNPPPDQQSYGSTYGTPTNNPLTTPPGGAPTGKSSTGLDANVAALLSYILTWVTGLVFFLIEKDSRFVRFHAMQSILLGASYIVIFVVFTIIQTMIAFVSGVLAAIFGLIWLLLMLAFLAVWVMCLIKAYQGQTFKLPVIGNMAEGIVNK
ncbi:MAG TPA: DUF4870 domain-containing protein [Pyrinomonadaceae bacterium]|jgi:uncharacterized membrane protein|nr:DUF4870 domain-containing protein [Pyrinomonadaceae bacterium]